MTLKQERDKQIETALPALEPPRGEERKSSKLCAIYRHDH
jgi:hypothetical protein